MVFIDFVIILPGAKEVPEEYRNEMMEMLISHTRNACMEKRIRQPDLFSGGELNN